MLSAGPVAWSPTAANRCEQREVDFLEWKSGRGEFQQWPIQMAGYQSMLAKKLWVDSASVLDTTFKKLERDYSDNLSPLLG